MSTAGIPLDQVAGSQTAVYEASMVDDYNRILLKDADNMPRTTATGTAHAILANRVSWFFNFLGPSIHIDTACSGSMVAMDLACNSLRNGDSSMASRTLHIFSGLLTLIPGFSCRLELDPEPGSIIDALSNEFLVT
jgi:acyl transferase domain-containing protein